METSNIEPQTSNKLMEVHHHSHSGHDEAKKWTTHLWDFFMLFLAVTLGFFVENQREHYVEHQREKLYMKSMVGDLEKDTVMLHNVLIRTQRVLDNIDTALTILQTTPVDKNNIATLYRVNLKLLSYTSPSFTDRTTVQLKNAGAMRLIRNEETVGGIVNYWSTADDIKLISEQLDDFRVKARERSYGIFNQKYYAKGEVNNLQTSNDMKLMIQDSYVLTEFANRLSHIQGLAMNRYQPAIKGQIEKASDLIETIKNHY
jgi:hypothetical protein